MAFECSARITVTTKMGENGDVSKKSFNGTCALGLKPRSPKRAGGSIATRAEAYMQAVYKSLGKEEKGTYLYI